MFKTEGFGAIYSIVYSEQIIERIFWKYSIISNFIFLRKNDWQKEGYPVYYVLCSARAQNNKKCASGSVGGARPCQGRGRGFESRLALWKIGVQLDTYFFIQICTGGPLFSIQ